MFLHRFQAAFLIITAITFAAPLSVRAFEETLLAQDMDGQQQQADIYRKQGQYTEALALYDKILAQKPDHQDALMGKAYVLLKQKDKPAATALAEQVLALNPKNIDALLFLASIKQTTEPVVARNFYQEVLALQPENAEAKSGLEQLTVSQEITSTTERRILGSLTPPDKKWQVEAGGGAQDFNYNSTAPLFYLQVLYRKPKRYYLQGRYDYLNKFGDQASQFTVGGGYYVHRRLILNDSFSMSTTGVVLPKVQNNFEIDGIAPYGFVPYLRFQYRHYDTANIYVIRPGFEWYYSTWFIFDFNYSLAVNDISGLAAQSDNSYVTRLTFIPIENRFSFFIYYGRTEESFDTGNAFQIGLFHANVVGGGFEWVMVRDIGLKFYTEYENRDNGQTQHGYVAGIFWRF